MQNATPLKYGVLPPELEKFRNLNRDKDKYEQLAKILLLGRHVDAEVLLPAVDWANRSGSPTFDTVRFYLQTRNIQMTGQDKAITEGMDIAVDEPEFTAYDTLYTISRQPTSETSCVGRLVSSPKGVDCDE